MAWTIVLKSTATTIERSQPASNCHHHHRRRLCLWLPPMHQEHLTDNYTKKITIKKRQQTISSILASKVWFRLVGWLGHSDHLLLTTVIIDSKKSHLHNIEYHHHVRLSLSLSNDRRPYIRSRPYTIHMHINIWSDFIFGESI